jgi:hypothetical protein
MPKQHVKPYPDTCIALFTTSLFCVVAGPLSQTHRELWTALSPQTYPFVFGNITTPALTQAEAALNNQTTALLASLLAQSSSSSSSSSGTELGIANGIWTNQLPVVKGYADSMWQLYKVRRHVTAQHTALCDLVILKSVIFCVTGYSCWWRTVQTAVGVCCAQCSVVIWQPLLC